MTRLIRLQAVALVLATGILGGPPPDLANRLANANSRSQAVKEAIASGNEVLPILLELSRRPPANLDKWELFVGIADAFGAMRAIEGTEFLVDNIGLRRHMLLEPWMKTPEIMEERLPAAAALIRIGPKSLTPLMDRYFRMEPEPRRICLFVIGRIHDPTTRTFLESIITVANAELSWAQKALATLPPDR